MHFFDDRDDQGDPGRDSRDTDVRSGAARKKAEMRARWGLTPREAQLALCLADGLSYDEIATRLNLSPHTVASHVKSILSKTQAGSSRKLAAMIAKL